MLQAPADFLLGQNHFLHSFWATWKVTPHTGFSVTSTQNSQSQISFASYRIHFSVLRLNFIPFQNIPSCPYSSFRNLTPHSPCSPLCPGKGQPSWAQVASLVALMELQEVKHELKDVRRWRRAAVPSHISWQPSTGDPFRQESSPCLSLRESPAPCGVK